MKILFVLEYYYPHIGGVERLFKALAEHLVNEGHEVMVLTNRFDKTLRKRESINGVSIRRLNFRNRYIFTFLSLPWVVKYARKVDLIHTTSFNAALPAYLGAKLLGKKSIITFHEAWGKLWFQLPFLSKLNKRLFYTYERLILNLGFDRFVAVSEYTKSSLKDSGVAENQLVKIYNGLEYNDLEREPKKTIAPFTYTFFGRLGPSKGIDILMEASTVFLRTQEDARLKLIVSTEPQNMLDYIKKTIAEHDLQERVVIQHHLSDESLKKELLSSSCVVIPSISEGFCFAAAETVAMGIPIISSHMGALKEVVSGDFITMDAYHSTALVDALTKAYKGKWQHEALRKFELKASLNNYENLYADILLKE